MAAGPLAMGQPKRWEMTRIHLTGQYLLRQAGKIAVPAETAVKGTKENPRGQGTGK